MIYSSKLTTAFSILLFVSCNSNNTLTEKAENNKQIAKDSSSLTPLKKDFTQNDFKREFINYFNQNKSNLTTSAPENGVYGCEVENVLIADLNKDSLNDALINYQFTGEYGNTAFSEIGVVINKNGKLSGQVLESKIGSASTGKIIDRIDDNGIIELTRYEWAPEDSHAGGPSITIREQYLLKNGKLKLLKRISREQNGAITTY